MLSRLHNRCFREGSRPLWALIVVALIELALFAEYCELRWHSELVRGPAACQTGEGLVIRVDGLQYYAWLRSMLIDGDLSFDNEFDEHNPMGDWLPPPTHRTPLGKRYNMSSIGPALVWSVTIVPAHYLLKVWHPEGSAWAANGYTWPYQLLVGCTTLAVCFAGLGLLYGICRQVARPSRAAAAAAFITLGTTIVFYSSVDVSWAHGIGTGALAWLVYYWLKTYGSMQPRRWLLVGVLVGMTALVRWSLVTYAILPATEGVLALWRSSDKDRGPWQALFCLYLAALGAGTAFLPQMMGWHALFGAWLLIPTPQVTHHWLRPSLWELLLGTDRSLFYWTPMALLACIGYGLYLRPWRSVSDNAGAFSACRPEPLALLFLAFLFQVYSRASVLGRGAHFLPEAGYFGGVYLGEAYGCRFLTESLVALAPGLALLFERASLRCTQLLYAVGYLLLFWNLLLVYQYCFQLLPFDGGASPSMLLRNTSLVARSKPSVPLQVLLELLVLALVVGWPRDRVPAGPSQMAGSLKDANSHV